MGDRGRRAAHGPLLPSPHHGYVLGVCTRSLHRGPPTPETMFWAGFALAADRCRSHGAISPTLACPPQPGPLSRRRGTLGGTIVGSGPKKEVRSLSHRRACEDVLNCPRSLHLPALLGESGRPHVTIEPRQHLVAAAPVERPPSLAQADQDNRRRPGDAGAACPLLLVLASQGASASTAASRALPAPSSVTATLIPKSAVGLQPGAVVRSASLGERVFPTAKDGFALAGVGGAYAGTYPAASVDAGKVWQVDGPPLYVAAADAPAVVSQVGAAGPEDLLRLGRARLGRPSGRRDQRRWQALVWGGPRR